MSCGNKKKEIIFGWMILFAINPITSTMIKYYEQTKSKYSRDIDHLVSINKNGVWIKEKKGSNLYIINADRLENDHLINVSINIIFNRHWYECARCTKLF